MNPHAGPPAGPARLSEEQELILAHPTDRPAVVDAGAGTGKTHTIVERVWHLHASNCCPASHILLLTFARKAAAELRSRLVQRLGGQAPVCSTFHAFAWSVLSAHPYDAGLAPETTVLEDPEARVEFRRAFEEFLADPTAGPTGFPLRPHNRDELARDLFNLLENFKQEGIALSDVARRAEAAADAFARIPYRELRKPYRRKVEGRDHKVELTITDQALRQEVAWEKQRIATCLAVWERFTQRLAARHALTYADLLLLAERALREDETLRRTLRQRYRLCIVDEYQDTDRAQHRFLQALFGDDVPCVMVVGDVLQSIFSFRGAHPANVDRIRQAPGVACYSLHHNRRSRQEILDLAHTIVRQAHPQAAVLQAARGAAQTQIVEAASIWGPSGVFVPAELAREHEAEWVARHIRAALDAGLRIERDGRVEPLQPRHIAILSRTKRNMQPVTDALVRYGVPFVFVGGTGFYDAPEIRDAVAWIRLLADPLDAPAAARALQSPTVGASDAVAARVAAGIDADETAFARRVLTQELPTADGPEDLDRAAAEACRRMRTILDRLAPYASAPLTFAVRAVLDATQAESHYRAGGDPRGAQALANLARLEALARSFAQNMPAAQPADFVTFMRELEDVDFDEREADVSSADAVTIATIHAAKGLEWPYVFVLGVWPRLSDRTRLRIDPATGALLYADNPDGSRSFHYESVRRHADGQGYVQPEAAGPDPSEETRLFYVALTRARDRLFVSGPRGKPSKGKPYGSAHRYLEAVYHWLQHRDWPADQPAPNVLPSRRAVAVPPLASASAPAVPTRPADERSAMTGGVLSYSLIAAYEQCPRQARYKSVLGLPGVRIAAGTPAQRVATALAAIGLPQADDPDATPDAAELAAPDSLLGSSDYGLVLHKACERWARDRKTGQPELPASQYVHEAAGQLGLTIEEAQAAQAVQALAGIARALDGWQPLHVEAPFLLDLGEGDRPLLVRGYLDLLAQDAQGRPCLVDYKTGKPRAQYALQLALYAEAARRVYGLDDVRCYVGHVDGARFRLKEVQPVPAAEMRRRVLDVRAGLTGNDDTARPGEWCWTCPYRKAPCLAYTSARRHVAAKR
jgi:ATP-dependent helicase/nuclease subunit A